MSARAAMIAGCLLVALASAGCDRFGERGTLPPLAIPLTQGASIASFERLVALTRAQGYQIDFADAEYGVFGVRARASAERGMVPSSFVVQCYADGTATLTVLGGRPLPTGRTRVSDAVRREAVSLAQELDEERPRW